MLSCSRTERKQQNSESLLTLSQVHMIDLLPLNAVVITKLSVIPTQLLGNRGETKETPAPEWWSTLAANFADTGGFIMITTGDFAFTCVFAFMFIHSQLHSKWSLSHITSGKWWCPLNPPGKTPAEQSCCRRERTLMIVCSCSECWSSVWIV